MTEAPHPNVHSPHSPWSDLFKSLSGTLVIAIFVVTFIVQAFQIPSESMENTLLIGDYLLVDKLHFGADGFWDRFIPYRTVHRGDIVVFHYPVDPSVHFVKRVVGIPGDKIRIIDKKVYVNGVRLDEPYVRYLLSHNPYRDEFPKLDLGVMMTDPARVRRTDPGNPDVCPVGDLHKIFSDAATNQNVNVGCRSAGIGCIECKGWAADSLVRILNPMQERRHKYEENPRLAWDILETGSEQARKRAGATMDEVRCAMGMSLNFEGGTPSGGRK